MPSVTDYTKADYIHQLEATNKFKAIEELAMVFKNTDVCDDMESLVRALKEREEIMSTGIGFGIAIPHAKINSIREMAFAIGVSKAGIDFDSMDGEPVHLVILVAAGERQHKEYLRLLSNIMSIIKKENVKDRIINSKTKDDVITILHENG
ncbi:MAG: PTS sugar transporter subunit IIA [Chrysiogenales bacterium]|nr:MAG: PTS sugar transporter subunit IIA [Chrysiogenales bacterium]